MTRLDMVRTAVAELGDRATAEQVVQFVGDRFKVVLGAKFVPVYRATLRAEEELKRARERAAAVLAGDPVARRAWKRPTSRTAMT
jgi:hypothetical protein